MAWVDQYRALARYNVWMNDKLYAAAAELTDDERKRDRGAFFKSVHGTLGHLMLGDSIWMHRFTGDASFRPRDAHGQPLAITSMALVLYEQFSELRQARSALDARIVSWVGTLHDDALSAEFNWKTNAGAEHRSVLWQTLTHFFNHQTHHRGQATTLLSQQGLDVGSTDLVAMLREETV